MGSSSWLVPLVNSPSFGAHKGMTFQKGEVAHFVAHCTEATLCIKGEQKEGNTWRHQRDPNNQDDKTKAPLAAKKWNQISFHPVLEVFQWVNTHILDAVECLLTSLLRWSPILCWWKCWLGIDWEINLCSPKKSSQAVQQSRRGNSSKLPVQWSNCKRTSKTTSHDLLCQLIHFDVMGIYRDKTVHYKYYNTLYQTVCSDGFFNDKGCRYCEYHQHQFECWIFWKEWTKSVGP